MDIAAIKSFDALKYVNNVQNESGVIKSQGQASFDGFLKSAIDMIDKTNQLSNAAQAEEINYSLGYTDNLHDVMAAQRKASLSLQYVVNIRNTAMAAYREIMSMQF
jgi:flagellar hook-basal body complex protein FliE